MRKNNCRDRVQEKGVGAEVEGVSRKYKSKGAYEKSNRKQARSCNLYILRCLYDNLCQTNQIAQICTT